MAVIRRSHLRYIQYCELGTGNLPILEVATLRLRSKPSFDSGQVIGARASALPVPAFSDESRADKSELCVLQVLSLSPKSRPNPAPHDFISVGALPSISAVPGNLDRSRCSGTSLPRRTGAEQRYEGAVWHHRQLTPLHYIIVQSTLFPDFSHSLPACG